MTRNTSSAVQRMVRGAIEYDNTREGFALEHHLVLAASSALAVAAFMAPSRGSAAIRGIGAGLLLMRALSGTQGVRSWVNATDRRRGAPLTPEEVRATWYL